MGRRYGGRKTKVDRALWAGMGSVGDNMGWVLMGVKVRQICGGLGTLEWGGGYGGIS